MAELFGRKWELVVGDLDISNLDLKFSVTKSTKREPNTAVIQVFNLSKDNRGKVESNNLPAITLSAGYGDDLTVIFAGNVRRAESVRYTADVITKIEASDKGLGMQKGRLSKSYSPGTSVVTVVRDLLRAMELGQGNLSLFEEAYRGRNRVAVFPDGYAVSGQCKRHLNSLIRAAGLRWSVQDGVLQLQRAGRPLDTQAVLLTPSSGLVSTPSRSAPSRGKRPVVNVKALIQPALYPGARVVLRDTLIEGDFEIKKVTYEGDTRGTPWYANLELGVLQ